jgi:hypothetical protein
MPKAAARLAGDTVATTRRFVTVAIGMQRGRHGAAALLPFVIFSMQKRPILAFALMKTPAMIAVPTPIAALFEMIADGCITVVSSVRESGGAIDRDEPPGYRGRQ